MAERRRRPGGLSEHLRLHGARAARNAGAQDQTSKARGSPFEASPGSGAGNGSGNGGDRNPVNPTGDGDLGPYEKIGAIPMDDADLEMTDIEQGQIGDCWPPWVLSRATTRSSSATT